jgi:hypothetical protein
MAMVADVFTNYLMASDDLSTLHLPVFSSLLLCSQADSAPIGLVSFYDKIRLDSHGSVYLIE